MLINEKNDQVVYRHMTIPTPDGQIAGFALWYKSENQAKSGFKKFHDYISASGDVQRSLNIEFEKDSTSTYRLQIVIMVDENLYNTEISGIESLYIRKLIESLGDFQFYFITAGYDTQNGEPKMLPITEYNFFKQAVTIDGKTIVGTRKKRWPRELFESSQVNFIQDNNSENQPNN